MRRRSTIRLRLTLFYGVVFTLCGLALLYLSYKFVSEGLLRDEGRSDERVIETYGYNKEQVDFFYNLQTPPSPTRPDAKNVGDVIRGIQGDIRTEVLHQLLIGSGFALAAMVVVSAGVGWLAAGRALRPVGRMTSRAKQLSQHSLHERLAHDGPSDELKELADTLDGMLERLEAAFEAQRRFSANVSHELRTPLAVMRAEADLTLDLPEATARERRLAQAVRDASERSEALLDSLLALARSESTMKDRDSIDLADLAGDVVAAAIDAADRAKIEVDLELGSAPVAGDRWLLERLVGNLVDNAITHNRRGGWIHVLVDQRGDRAIVEVKNSGDELSAGAVEQILEPFQRADRNRPGYGLGMTIVQAVAQAHDGTVSVAPRITGGLDVLVSLPLAGKPARPVPQPAPVPAPALTGVPAGEAGNDRAVTEAAAGAPGASLK